MLTLHGRYIVSPISASIVTTGTEKKTRKREHCKYTHTYQFKMRFQRISLKHINILHSPPSRLRHGKKSSRRISKKTTQKIVHVKSCGVFIAFSLLSYIYKRFGMAYELWGHSSCPKSQHIDNTRIPFSRTQKLLLLRTFRKFVFLYVCSSWIINNIQ